MPNGGLLSELERRFGLPPLAQIANSFDRLPDARQLRLIKEVLTIAERVARTGPELEKVIALIREINSMPTEKLEKVEKILKRIEGIMKKAPQELLGLLASLKEE